MVGKSGLFLKNMFFVRVDFSCIICYLHILITVTNYEKTSPYLNNFENYFAHIVTSICVQCFR